MAKTAVQRAFENITVEQARLVWELLDGYLGAAEALPPRPDDPRLAAAADLVGRLDAALAITQAEIPRPQA